MDPMSAIKKTYYNRSSRYYSASAIVHDFGSRSKTLLKTDKLLHQLLHLLHRCCSAVVEIERDIPRIGGSPGGVHSHQFTICATPSGKRILFQGFVQRLPPPSTIHRPSLLPP